MNDRDRGTMLEWLLAKCSEAKQALIARDQAEETWRSGSSQSWRAVGCRLTAAQRKSQADIEARIAAKYRRDVEMFEVLLSILEAHDD